MKRRPRHRPGTTLCVEQVNVCDICKNKSNYYVFVRYYEVLWEDKVPFDWLEKEAELHPADIFSSKEITSAVPLMLVMENSDGNLY